MKTACLLTAMTAVLLVAADAPPDVRWTFENAQLGKLPEGWSSAKAVKGPGSVWKIVKDDSAPSGPRVLAQTSSAGSNAQFNLCVLDQAAYADVEIAVSFKAVQGRFDRGGGPVWRYQDANNYYICRQNPLEDNFRLYKVVNGRRRQLASIRSNAKAGFWHTIHVTMRGDRIKCSVDNQKLDVQDQTITKAGKVGLWTKADAVTHFDDFHIHNLAK